MTSRASDLLVRLEAAGATVTTDGLVVWVRPASVLTPELRAEVRQRKAEIIEQLAARRREDVEEPSVLEVVATLPEPSRRRFYRRVTALLLDASLSRAEAERQALAEITESWRAR